MRRTLLGALVAAPLALAGCGSGSRTPYVLATAEPGGFFNSFGELLAGVVADSAPSITLTVQTSRGSSDNFDRLRTGAAQFAMALADGALALHPDIRAVGRVYENYLQVAVPANSDVQTLADLRGRPVSLGNATGTTFTAERVLAGAGLAVTDVVNRPIPVLEVLDALTDDRIDAAIFLGGVPHPPVDPAGKRAPAGGIRLIDLAAVVPELRRLHGPVYQPVVLQPGLYGAGGTVTTLGVSSLVVARPDVRDDAVAEIVDVLRSRSDALVPPGTFGAQYLDARSLVYTFGIPLHPGAERAYREGHG